jgi:hypothetical protein
MMRLKKILLFIVTMILVAAISVTATIAYLKSQTDVVPNAFAVGNVKVSLDEAKVNENGQLVDENGNVVDDVKDAARVIFNSCELAPGGVYNIAPTVHVEEGSEDCIVFVLLCMPRSLENVIYNECISPQIIANGWLAPGFRVPDGAVGSEEFGVVFCYNQAQPVAANTSIPFFESITIDEDVTPNELKRLNLNELRITAFAFQNEGTNDMYVRDVWNIILETYYPVGLKKQ